MCMLKGNANEIEIMFYSLVQRIKEFESGIAKWTNDSEKKLVDRKSYQLTEFRLNLKPYTISCSTRPFSLSSKAWI